MIVVAGEALMGPTPDGDSPTRSGGSSANVAVTLARLGHRVELLDRPGDDPLPNLSAEITAIHSGSPALTLGPGAAVLEDLLRREHDRGRVTVSIDLDRHPSIMADAERERARVARQIRCAHIVKAGEDDLAWLYPGVPPAAILASWRDAGVLCGVVTHGGDGAYLLAPNWVAYRRTAPAVRVLDTVGAGDAFTGGMLGALADRHALGDRPAERLADVGPQEWLAVLDRAVEVAALTCTRRGANPPTRAELALATG